MYVDPQNVIKVAGNGSDVTKWWLLLFWLVNGCSIHHIKLNYDWSQSK